MGSDEAYTRGVKGRSNQIDAHVGIRLRIRRTLTGMSQDHLAKLIGLTFQQIQKYENGKNRVSASRMFQLAHVLDVPISFFFDDMPPEISGLAAGPTPTIDQDTARRETLELVRAYYKISDPAMRRRLFALTKAVGGIGGDLDDSK